MPKKFQFTQEEHDKVIILLDKIDDADLHVKVDVLRLKMEGYKNKEAIEASKKLTLVTGN